MWLFIRVYTVCIDKEDLQTKELIFFLKLQCSLYQTSRNNPLVYKGLRTKCSKLCPPPPPPPPPSHVVLVLIMLALCLPGTHFLVCKISPIRSKLAWFIHLTLVIYVCKLPLGAWSIRACSIIKLQKWIRC